MGASSIYFNNAPIHKKLDSENQSYSIYLLLVMLTLTLQKFNVLHTTNIFDLYIYQSTKQAFKK